MRHPHFHGRHEPRSTLGILQVRFLSAKSILYPMSMSMSTMFYVNLTPQPTARAHLLRSTAFASSDALTYPYHGMA